MFNFKRETTLFCWLLYIPSVISPPPKPLRNLVEKDNLSQDDDSDFNYHYHPYLKRVVDILNADPHGQQMLAKLQVDEISLALGNFTHEFKLKSKEAYEQLNRLKLEELTRLEHLRNSKKNVPHDLSDHIDSSKSHFDHVDLVKLLQRAIADIETNRKEAYKYYEMEKQYNETEKLKHMTAEQKAAYEAHEKEKHAHLEAELKQNPPHAPGSKEAFEEVAQKQDHLENFDPRSFFFEHDLNGDGFWDAQEMDVVLQNEADKRYPNKDEVDLIERDKYVDDLRRELLEDIDLDKDDRVSLDEFIQDLNDEQGHPDSNPDYNEVAKLREHTTLYTDEEFNQMVRERELYAQHQLTTMSMGQLANPQQNNNNFAHSMGEPAQPKVPPVAQQPQHLNPQNNPQAHPPSPADQHEFQNHV